MNKLNLLKSLGFKISWKLIKIGLYGYMEIPILLTYDDIHQYLIEVLCDNTCETDKIVSLILEKENHCEFDKILNNLEKEDKSDITIQIRKWKVYLLKSILDNSNQDYFQGILEFMKYWTIIYPHMNSPMIFPDEKISKEEYFTKSTYDYIFNLNRMWFEQEILNIIKAETELDDSSVLINDGTQGIGSSVLQEDD